MMSFFALKSPLTAGDRIERRRLIFADTLALVTLFAITALLAVMVWGEPVTVTVAVATAPALLSVTPVTVSLLTRPLVVNSVPAKVTVCP